MIQQGSACFILEVDDNMPSIINRVREESILFKSGSGSGANNSRLRGSMEGLSGGGTSSGPISFMMVFDAFADVIKSGGKTRRAAKMEIIDVDHPDIFEFIRCKAEQEVKARQLKQLGYGQGTINANSEVRHQNANHSVRVNKEFMEAVLNDEFWNLIGRKGFVEGPTGGRLVGTSADNTKGIRMIDQVGGPVIKTVKAREIWDELCRCAWECGCPGVFFDDNVNEMNTVPWHGRIESSNPCSEFLHPNNTACNLASLNLDKFFIAGDDGIIHFDQELFDDVVHTMIVAMDIIAGNATYPTEKITENSKFLRPLGLGYSNLGAVLMKLGYPYDSDEARAIAGTLTAHLTGRAYYTSAWLMKQCGFSENLDRDSMLRVMTKHHASATKLSSDYVPGLESGYVKELWEWVLESGGTYGFRNSQATVLAPTGTISFMMDCSSTGCEPMLAVLSKKYLAGGGVLDMGLPDEIAECMKSFLNRTDGGDLVWTVDDEVKWALSEAEEDQLKSSRIFDTALGGVSFSQPISYLGHINMLGAIQPFLSGGISKTINLPNSFKVEDVSTVFLNAWKLGLKAVTLYRDGSKAEQPVEVEKEKEAEKKDVAVRETRARKPLPDERKSITHKFRIGEHKGYLILGMYENEELGEMFITMSKEGSMVRGLMDAFATAVSIGLQYGVPVNLYASKFIGTKFEPAGMTQNDKVRFAKSVLDYIFRYVTMKFTEGKYTNGDGRLHDVETQEPEGEDDLSGEPCPECGIPTVQMGSCQYCMNCNISYGCS
jgi:ribonucleoside-diphosphate reductase alpha chain